MILFAHGGTHIVLSQTNLHTSRHRCHHCCIGNVQTDELNQTETKARGREKAKTRGKVEEEELIYLIYSNEDSIPRAFVR